jgi:dTDP-4-dehydrorhamnose reductase
MNKILVLGVNGMLGNTIFRYFSTNNQFDVIGVCRQTVPELASFSKNIKIVNNLIEYDSLINIFNSFKPSVVINCVGIIKQSDISKHVLDSIPVNSLFPHRLAGLCGLINARLIHFSTDCVFSGNKGSYLESHNPDPIDLYGRSKLIGEVMDQNSITLRTSIIGHELKSNKSLLNWFLSSQNEIKGFKNAYFSGLTTLEVAKVIEKHILPNSEINGLFHLASDRISKYELLSKISEVYNHKINIIPEYDYFIDRSLNCDKFINKTGYSITPWSLQINEMYKFK